MLKALPRLEPTPLLSQRAQEAIKDYILTNNLKPGDALPPETLLVRQLGISRNSVREAVKALAALGIIEVRRGDGLYVGTFSLKSLLENLPYGTIIEIQELEYFTEVRCILEVGMIAKAIQSLTPDQLTELRAIVERMRECAESGDVAGAQTRIALEDREFHRALFANLGNTVLLTLLDTFWLTFHKASQHADLQNRDLLTTYHRHLRILDAVASGDVAEARVALEQHYAGLQERMAAARVKP